MSQNPWMLLPFQFRISGQDLLLIPLQQQRQRVCLSHAQLAQAPGTSYTPRGTHTGLGSWCGINIITSGAAQHRPPLAHREKKINTISPEDSCLKRRFCIFFTVSILRQSPEEMDEPSAEGSRANETWLSGRGCHRQQLSIKNALPPFARHSKARRAVKSIPAEHNHHHYLQGDTEEGESCFGFFEAYFFQWKCYQKGQIFKPARAAPSLHFHPPHTELFSGP